MLTKIKLANFRGFADHELPILPLTLIVGRNNAGKSTIIEALRFIALATARYQTMTYVDAPEEFDLPDTYRGITPSLRDLNVERRNLFYRYGEPPATIVAEFGNAGSIAVYLYGNDEIFIVVRNERNQIVPSNAHARRVMLPRINILPQLVPVSDSEERLNETYLRRSLSTARSSIHFRNELLILQEYYDTFKRLCEESWPRLQIQELLTDRGELRNELELLVRDEDFVGDVRWMGHGLQIWLQTMWFLARVSPQDIIVLDEPDVFLHADLQRKLIRILKNQERQSIIATHSIEMMAELDPSSILIADRRRERSQFATSLPAVQDIIDHMGGVHNIQLARLWSHKKVIFVEGEDISLLKVFQDKLYPASVEPLDILPNFSIGGWGGWNLVIGSSITFKSGGGENIAKYCILDRDYHTADEITDRRGSASTHNVRLHIWEKKEIENYVIVPSVIERYINNGKRKGPRITLGEVETKLDEICENLKDEVLDLISQQFNYAHRPKNPSDGNRYARMELRNRWTSLFGKLSVVGGKTVISRVSEWSQRTYGVGVTAHLLARLMVPAELDAELVSIMGAIENGTPLTSQ